MLRRDTTATRLYDDGTHGDMTAGDGVYSATFARTEMPGSYTFRFAASNIQAPQGLTTTREWTMSFFNEVNITPEHSDIRVTRVGSTADGDRDTVSVAPMDRYGNYLGPGHDIQVALTSPTGVRPVAITDNVDGTYSGEVVVSPGEIDAGAHVEVGIDGQAFTTAPLPRLKRWSASIHGGLAVTTGAMASDFAPGVNVLGDVDYHLSRNWSLVGLVGFNGFKSATPTVADNYWITASASLGHNRVVSGPISLYIGGGPGVYHPETGDTEFGLNAEAGIDVHVATSLDVEVGGNYHAVIGEDIRFVHTHAGIVLRF